MKSQKYDIIIRNGNIVTHESTYKADLGIMNGKIKEIIQRYIHIAGII